MIIDFFHYSYKTIILFCCFQIGNPTNNHETDPEGKPESIPSKIAKQGTKLAASLTKTAVRAAAASGAVDQDTVDNVEAGADAVKNQAEAGRDATVADRLKMAAGDTAGIVADNVDDPYVSVSFKALGHSLCYTEVCRIFATGPALAWL